MPLPGDVTTVTLTGHFEDASGAPLRGTVTFTPSGVIKDTSDTIILEPVGIPVTISATGTFSVVLPCTDASVLQPSGWSYTVAESLSYTYGGPAVASRSYIIQLPSSLAPTVDLAQITPIGSATTPPSGTIGNVVVSGTPSTGQIIVATSATTANWQTSSGGGGTPSNTVVAETSYGQASSAGSATTYSRGDHTHGSTALTTTAPATTEAIGTAAALGAATLPALADHVHPMAAAGTPTNSAVGDTAATGNATTFAASNHLHGREAFGAVVALGAFGVASTNGTATTVAHSDHVHGAPTLPAGSTSAAGILQLDGTATDIAALGAQAAGAVGKAADAGHVHPTTGVVLTSSLPLAPASGGTGQTSAAAAYNALSPITTLGDLIAGSGANTAARVAGNTSTTKQFLTQTGTGSVSATPAWGAIAAGDLPTATTSAPGAVQLDGTASDIQPLGTRAAGAAGLAADAKHVHSSSMATFQLSTSPISGGVLTSDGSGNGSWAYPGALLGADRSPAIFGLVAQTTPVYGTNLKTNQTAGTAYLALIRVPAGQTISKLSVIVGTAGVTSSGTNQLGLFSASGTLLTVTGDMTTAFSSTGWAEGTLGASQTPSVDTNYYIGTLTHFSGTVPAFEVFNLVNAPPAINGVYPTQTLTSVANLATFTPGAGQVTSVLMWAGAR